MARPTPSFPADSPPIIAICWEDASYTRDDVHESEIGDLVQLYEIGFLIKETPISYVVCCEYQPGSDTHRLALTIPKNSVKWCRICRDGGRFIGLNRVRFS